MSSINFSDPMTIAILSVVVLAIILAIAAIVHKRNTTARLRSRFGSEYDRAVVTHGSPREAEAKLADRESRVKTLVIRDLGITERERFVTEWHTVQSRFVDHPKSAVTDADDLVNSLLEARGYPSSSFDQRADDVSVHYPRVMENYRLAHGIAVRPDRVDASTEELRTAMIQYRAIFDELVQDRKRLETRTAA